MSEQGVEIEWLAEYERLKLALTESTLALNDDTDLRPYLSLQEEAEKAERALDALFRRLTAEIERQKEEFRAQIRDISRGAKAGAITAEARRWVKSHLADDDLPEDIEGLILSLLDRAERAEARLTAAGLDKCEVCHGKKGGVPGNENIVNGVIMCDYCHAEEEEDAVQATGEGELVYPSDDSRRTTIREEVDGDEERTAGDSDGGDG